MTFCIFELKGGFAPGWYVRMEAKQTDWQTKCVIEDTHSYHKYIINNLLSLHFYKNLRKLFFLYKFMFPRALPTDCQTKLVLICILTGKKILHKWFQPSVLCSEKQQKKSCFPKNVRDGHTDKKSNFSNCIDAFFTMTLFNIFKS